MHKFANPNPNPNPNYFVNPYQYPQKSQYILLKQVILLKHTSWKDIAHIEFRASNSIRIV